MPAQNDKPGLGKGEGMVGNKEGKGGADGKRVRGRKETEGGKEGKMSKDL